MVLLNAESEALARHWLLDGFGETPNPARETRALPGADGMFSAVPPLTLLFILVNNFVF